MISAIITDRRLVIEPDRLVDRNILTENKNFELETSFQNLKILKSETVFSAIGA